MQIFWIVVIVVVGSLLGLWVFRRLGILDKPGPDVVPIRKPVPTMQWLIIYGILIVVVSALYPQWWSLALFQWLFAWVSIIVLITLLDEIFYIRGKKDVPALGRLIAQIIAAIVAISIWHIAIDERVFQGMIIHIPFVVFAWFFVLRSLLCINAINRFDGVTGQASGVSSIWFLTIVLLIHFVVLPYYSTISLVNADVLQWISDISLVFFVVSFIYTLIEYKPYGLVRDIGTMMFGFALAYLSIVGGAKVGTLVVALSLVVFDAIWVAIHRLFFLKTNPLRGDYTHLHYRLLWLGRNKWEVRAFVWWWSLVMMILMLLQGADRWGKIIVFVLMASIFFGVNAYLFWYKKLPVGIKRLRD